MKESYLAAILGIAASVLSAKGEGCVTPPSGLVGWWPAENNATDVVGSNNGAVGNGVAFTAGKVGQAFQFSLGNSGVTVPTSASLNVGTGAGFSVEGWIRPTSGSDQLPLVEWAYDGIGVGPHFWVSVSSVNVPVSQGGPGSLYANIVDINDGSHPFASLPGIVQTNDFQHVALTYDKTSGTAQMYRNGLVVATAYLGSFTPKTTSDLLLGRRIDAGSGAQFTGALDDISLYNRALDANEIAAIYNANSAGKCLPVSPPPSGVQIIAGPVTNNANGSVYFLLSGSTWPEAEAKAVELGGHLTTINDAAENDWVFNTFGLFGGTNRELWIGLNDAAMEGTFVWSSGEPVTFTRWYPGEPNNYDNDDYAHIWAPFKNVGAQWNDIGESYSVDGEGNPFCGVVEIPAALPPSSLLAPQITSFNPALGSNGTVVTLLGANFSPVAAGNIVYFGAVRALVTTASPTSLTVVVPAGATYAPPSVTVAGLTGQANRSFVPTFDNGGGSIDATAFAAKFDLSASSDQIAVSIGDMDGDGKPEVVVANAHGNSVGVYRNISTGGGLTGASFAPRVDYPVGYPAYGSSLGDMDGDGKLDIIVANNGDGAGNTVSVLRNTSTPGAIDAGSFAARVDFTVGAGPIRMSVGDLDGDGRLDLAVGAGSGVSVLRNTGAPGSMNASSFAPYVQFVTGGPNAWDVEIADLDGDGKRDLLVVNSDNGTVSMLRNVGSPGSLAPSSFAAKVDLVTGTTLDIAVGDLDGDGKPDLVVTRPSNGDIAVLRNLSVAGALTLNSFAPPVLFATGSGSQGAAIGDVDGDGKPDLAATVYNANRLSILRNISVVGSLTSSSFAAKVDYITGANPHQVALGDLNGDGRPDAVATSWGSSFISVLKNTVAPAPPSIAQNPTDRTVVAGLPTTFSVGVTGSAPLAYQWEFNEAAIPAATNSSYSIAAVQESQGGNYRAIVTNPFGVAKSSPALLTVLPPPSVPVITDFSPKTASAGTAVQLVGTNFSDVAVSNIVYFGAVRALVVAASPTSLTVVVPSGATFAPPSVTVAGLSSQASGFFLPTYAGDGVLDSSSFAPKVDFAANSPQVTVVTGDLDGDGKPDMVVGNYNASSISVYQNISSNGVITAAAFAPRVTFATGSTPYASLADVDGDGRLDILVANNGSGRGNTISIFRNTSVPGSLTTASFAARVNFTTGTGPLKIAAGDLDGDGKTDLAVCTTSSRVVSLLRNLGTSGTITASSFAARIDVAPNAVDRDVEMADLDGDGKLDLVLANYSGGLVSVLRNVADRGSLTTNSFAPRVNLVTGSTYNVALGDLDGDGHLDLVIGNQPASITVLRNLSTPGNLSSNTFAPKVSFPVGGEPTMVAIGDVDGDGRPDLAVSDTATTVSVLRNMTVPGVIDSTSFAARVSFTTGSPRNIVLGDLDADGRPDLTVAIFSSSVVSVLKNTAPFARPPVITEVTPATLLVNEGQDATFTATVTGTAPIYYQWQFGADGLADATNAVLTLTNVSYAQAGLYSLVASNVTGVVTSSNLVLLVNRLPLANADATKSLLVSPNGVNAVAVLDGSLSSDPDGDPLTYTWFITGDSNTITTGVVAVTSLPVGTNQLTLIVSDGLAEGSQSFIVEVITTSQAVDRLAALVADETANPQPLLATLRAALAAIDRSQPATAINQLQAFQNKVRAQVAPVDPVLAAQLIAEAQAIIDALEGGGEPAPISIEITSITKGDNGKSHLRIRGPAGRTHVVETSTNGVNWTKIGVANASGDGGFDFDDAQIPGEGTRFYRIVSPK